MSSKPSSKAPIIFLILFLGFTSADPHPEQVHLALTGNPGEMIISFMTMTNTSIQRIEYEIAPCEWNDPLKTNYAIPNYPNPLDNGGGRITYTYYVVLTELLSYEEYCWRFVNQDQENSQAENHILTPHDYSKLPLTVAMVGDLGVSGESMMSLLQGANSKSYDFVMHLGDIAYDLNTNQGHVGDTYMRDIDPIATRRPYMTCPGNHERDGNFTQYKARFNMPAPMYYTFRSSLTKFIVLHTDNWYDDNGFPIKSINDTSVGDLRLQLKWFENELREAWKDRKHHPWVVVIGHHPLWCSDILMDNTCSGKKDQTTILRNGTTTLPVGIEEMMYFFGVDIYMSAHVHAYERMYPLHQGIVLQSNYTNPKSFVHLMAGKAGVLSDMDVFTNQHNGSAFQSYNTFQAEYGHLTIINGTHATYTQYSTRDDSVVDQITIVVDHHGNRLDG